jgi:heptaprenyl diphosphate synthase
MAIALQTDKDDHLIAWLAALAITIHILEAGLPSPLPGVKPGLANVVTIITLCQFGWKTAAWVSLLRVLVGSIIIGTFLSPTFVLSVSGAVGGLIAVGLAGRLRRIVPAWAPGPIGYSVLAAMAHMAAQFFAAYELFIPNDALFTLLPVLMTAAVIFGVVSGMVANAVVKQIVG